MRTTQAQHPRDKSLIVHGLHEGIGQRVNGREASSALPRGRGNLLRQHRETKQQFRKDRSKVRASLVSFTLLITVISSLGLGVLLAHATIHWILRIFAPVARDTSESTSVLIAQEAAEQG